MEPISVVIWTCVAIFVATAILTLLHVSGLYVLPNPEHGKALFRALILEVVVIAVAAFGASISVPPPEGTPDNSAETPPPLDSTADNSEEPAPDPCSGLNPPLSCFLEKRDEDK